MNDTETTDILLIEDNAGDEELFKRALQKAQLPFSLCVCHDGQEALDCLSATGRYSGTTISEFLKLVVLDLKLPKFAGTEVLRAVRNDTRTCVTPVVVFTSSDEPEDIKECYRSGVNSYVVKPIEYAKYIDTIKELICYWLIINRTFP